MTIYPNAARSRAVREANSCHNPPGTGGGRFCSTDAHGTSSITAYHGTTEDRLNSILEKGLQIGYSGQIHSAWSKRDHTYVTTDPADAGRWAEYAKTKTTTGWVGGEANHPALAVLQVQIPWEDWQAIHPDEHFTKDQSDIRLAGSWGKANPTGRLQFAGNIKPEWITAVWVAKDPRGDGYGSTGHLKQVRGRPQLVRFTEAMEQPPVTLYVGVIL